MPSNLINPSKAKFNSFAQVLRWAQSVYTSLNQGVSFALGKGSNTSGVFNTFDITNGDGIMVRIGASGSGEHFSWNGSSQCAVAVNTLKRKPTGWILCDIDKSATIWRTVAPSTTQLTLQTSDATCSITVWIF